MFRFKHLSVVHCSSFNWHNSRKKRQNFVHWDLLSLYIAAYIDHLPHTFATGLCGGGKNRIWWVQANYLLLMNAVIFFQSAMCPWQPECYAKQMNNTPNNRKFICGYEAVRQLVNTRGDVTEVWLTGHEWKTRWKHFSLHHWVFLSTKGRWGTWSLIFKRC